MSRLRLFTTLYYTLAILGIAVGFGVAYYFSDSFLLMIGQVWFLVLLCVGKPIYTLFRKTYQRELRLSFKHYFIYAVAQLGQYALTLGYWFGEKWIQTIFERFLFGMVIVVIVCFVCVFLEPYVLKKQTDEMPYDEEAEFERQ